MSWEPMLTRAEDIAAASILVADYYDMRRARTRYLKWLKGPALYKPLVARGGSQSFIIVFEELVSQRLSQIDSILDQIMDQALLLATKYRYLAYLRLSPLPLPSLLAVAAFPPDVTWTRDRLVHTWTWITVSFLPPRHRGNIVAKVFKTTTLWNLKMTALRHRDGFYDYLNNKYGFKVAELWRKKYLQYLSRHNNKQHALMLSLRDLVRIYLGNAWLIATLDALSNNLIKREDIEAPYPLAKQPNGFTHKDLIDPAETIIAEKQKYQDYTWRKILDILGTP